MRNLSLVSSSDVELDRLNLSATTIDLDQNAVYAVSERSNMDGEVEIELWKVGTLEAVGLAGTPSLVSMFPTVAASQGPKSKQVVSFKVISELRRIVIITRGGDITTISLDESDPVPEIEGTVEPGILAASWAPDETLLTLVTGEQKLILMTSTFEVLSEKSIHTAEFGEDAPINVGWGSKQTQFHGSLGKAAAQAPTTTTKVGSSPDDDGLSRISWRGDGAYFVISSLSPPSPDVLMKRVLRVYDRQGVLQSTSEDVPGLEHPLVWRPSGNLTAGTQRFGFDGGGAGKIERHDVVFFERNGLRHGDFGLRVNDIGGVVKGLDSSEERKWGYRVRELSWNSDSNILSVWIEHDTGDFVQLWTTGNYHWYLKQEIAAPPRKDGQSERFTSVDWHPENPSCIILTTSTQVIHRIYAWETFTSPSQPPLDAGTVAVFDGSSILLTTFRTQNIPPPMASFQLSISPRSPESFHHYCSKTPIHASFSRICDSLGILWETGYLEIWQLHTRLGPGREKVLDPTKKWSGFIKSDVEDIRWRQIVLRFEDDDRCTAVALGSGHTRDYAAFVAIDGLTKIIALSRKNLRILDDAGSFFQDQEGEIFEPSEIAEGGLRKVSCFPEFCLSTQTINVPSETDITHRFFVGLSKSGKLHAADGSLKSLTIAVNATSVAVASGFVIYTTGTHDAVFAPIISIQSLLTTGGGDTLKDVAKDWQTRKVERGSRIVTAVPSTMSLVLQMPRGNLETINPRPLVMEVVKQDLDAGNYRKAFFACRKHRIDLKIIVDHNREKFLGNVASFIALVHEVDHLNLFLTNIGRGSYPPEILSTLCDSVRAELEKTDLAKYVHSILTAYVVKSPPDHEAALSLLLRLRDNDSTVVEDALKYIIFLVDANRLFDTALGMYDFNLVLMIAQHAQKDPREYLPFLRELRALDKYYQRFRIDDHLRRHQKALLNLSLAGFERFNEATDYIEKHQLYESALHIWKNTDRYERILEIYGDWLYERREFRQAASVFVEAKKFQKAMVSHEKALEWQELFTLSVQHNLSDEDELINIAYRIAEDLVSKKRHTEAARVLLDYAKDVREAIIALVGGNGFSEARRIISINRNDELLEDVVYPAAFESKAQFMEDITEMREQIKKQVARLRELRIKRLEEPDAFYGAEDPALANVDVMTDVSMAPTTFTRYTIAPSTGSRTSKRSSRSKRKLERKVGSGRKGTVDEEEYLLRSVSKLAERFKAMQDEVQSLLPHLLQFTAEHKQEGMNLQKDIESFQEELANAIAEIWSRPPEEGSEEMAPSAETWARRMEESEKNKRINPIERVPKPELKKDRDWYMRLYDY